MDPKIYFCSQEGTYEDKKKAYSGCRCVCYRLHSGYRILDAATPAGYSGHTGEGIYTGQLKGMTFHGYGTYVSYEIGGVSYEGEWKDGVFHGQGMMTFANGATLSGEFKIVNLFIDD